MGRRETREKKKAEREEREEREGTKTARCRKEGEGKGGMNGITWDKKCKAVDLLSLNSVEEASLLQRYVFRREMWGNHKTGTTDSGFTHKFCLKTDPEIPWW